MPSPGTTRRRAANDAVWALVLPPAERILCHAEQPPDLVRQWVRRGIAVDVVSRCDLEAWLQTSGAPGAGARLRCLWEPDRDRDYDLAILWDPASAEEVEAWLAEVGGLPLVPPEVAVWSRNPWCGARAPHWLRIDGLLRRHGWRLGTAHLGIPEPHRVRQLVDWRAYHRTKLLQHRRSHRAWKSWITHRPLFRWWLPVRLQRACMPALSERAATLRDVLDRAVAGAGGGDVRPERTLVSPNGVVISVLHLAQGAGAARAVLKAPYELMAEGRVARNAAGLEWVSAHAARLGRWGRAAPRLLSRGSCGPWSYTLEECVGGREASTWDPASIDRSLPELAGFLQALAFLAGPAERLDAAALDRLVGGAIRTATPLLEDGPAQRLRDLGSCLIEELASMRLPLVPRHGDFKLENVFGDPTCPGSWRVLDWELWSSRGLPLLDLWHLIASRRGRAAGVSMGEAVRRWLLPRDLSPDETQLVERLSRGLEPRYVELSPILYWLDRVAPIAARGAWPRRGWEASNVLGVLESIPLQAEVPG